MAEGTQSKRTNHTWQADEDALLVQCMVEAGPTWRADNGFKPGFAKHMEKMMHEKMPSCTLRASPHIESRIKQLKKHYTAICEMMGPRGGSGFGWNDQDKMIIVEKEIFKDWVKSHPNARGLYNKPFSYFDALGPVFGKDVAIGNNAEDAADALEQLDIEAEAAAAYEAQAQAETALDEDDPLDSFAETQSTPMNNITGNSSGSTAAKKGKKRQRSDGELIEIISDSIASFGEHLKDIVVSFKDDTGPSKRTAIIYDELCKIPGLTNMEQIRVAMILCKDSHLADLFLTLADPEAKRLLVSQIYLETRNS